VRKLILLIAAVVGLVLLTAPGALAQEAAGTVPAPSRATIVVLVDQSGSLSERDFAEEVRAVRTLKNVPDIDLYVFGFASKGSRPAIEQVCDVSSNLDDCAAELHRRADDSEGNDTDHATALASAALLFRDLGSDASAPKLVLLMTDGRFDPNGSGRPTSADQARLDSALASLKDLDVQVWPLGFGSAIDHEELERIAHGGFGGLCAGSDGPTSVVVSNVADVPGAVNGIIGSATCATPDFDVPEGTQSLVVYYAQSELGPDGTITVTGESGRSKTVACDFDELSGQWVCEIQTGELGPGQWKLNPAPVAFPFPFAKRGPDVSPTPPESTVPVRTVTTTTAPASPVAPVAPATSTDSGSGAFPWLLVLAGLLGLGALVWAFLRSRVKLQRGVVAVRSPGRSDWSPEETVRAQKRQAFVVHSDRGYPSIETTTQPAPDVVLEATAKGIFLSGSLVDERRRIALGEEVVLVNDMTLLYARTLDDDLDDLDDDLDFDDLSYEDSLI